MRACTPDLSIVVPVLNEANVLMALFAAFESQVGLNVEIVFCDGGSSDASVAMIEAYARHSKHRIDYVVGPPGRAQQMNRGADLATGELILFLHADSQWVDSDLFRNAVAHLHAYQHSLRSTAVAGHFSLTFALSGSNSIFYRYLSDKAQLNRRGTIYGDQGMLLPRQLWCSVGGFCEDISVLEDVVFANAVFDAGCWILLPQFITTSIRRYYTIGIGKTLMVNALLMIAGGTKLFCSPLLYAPAVHQHVVYADSFAQLVKQLRATLHQLQWRHYFSFWYNSAQTIIEFAWLPCYAASYMIPSCTRQQRVVVLCWYDRCFVPMLARPAMYALVAILAWLSFYLFYLYGVYSGPSLSKENTET